MKPDSVWLSRVRLSATVVLSLGVAVTGPACSRQGGPGGPASSRPAGGMGDPSREVTVVVVRPGLDASGVLTTFLEPVVDAPVPARHSGIVRAVEVTEGQRVRRGQVLARLEDDEQRIEVERASALAAQTLAEYERARKAAAGNLISQAELEVSRAREQAARAEADRARLDFDRCTLRAPVDGVVRLARAEPNMLVGEEEILFRIAETARLKGSLYLPAGLRPHLKAGAAVAVSPVADPSAAGVRGRIRLVNPMADPVTGLIHVEIEVSAAPGIAPGADVLVGLAGVELDGDGGAAATLAGALLPLGAYLERDADQVFVYKVAGGRVRRVPVELGDVEPDGFTVLSGVRAGDLVAAAGQAPPADGAAVRPRLSEGPGAR